MLALNPTGDLERKFDLEISPLCNQQADSVPAIQIGECTHTYTPVNVNSLVSSHEAKFLNRSFVVFLAGFISYIVEPLFEEWHRFTEPSPLSQTMMGHLHKNKARWSRLRYAHTPSDTETHSHADEPEPEGGGGEEEGEDIP